MYKTKQLISLILVLAMCLSLGTTAFATEISTAGSSAETPVVLNVEAALFSVTIPTGLPVDVAANGTVTVATDAKIINNSHGPVQVVNMTIEAVEGWTIANYDEDLKNALVDSNQISMIINELKTTGPDAIEFSADNFTVMLAKNDDTTDECSIVYNAKVTPLSEAFATDTVANLVFTVDWYKAEGNTAETTTSIPVVATDSEGNNLNATSTDIIGTEKDDLLAKLEESGLVSSADEVDALIEVETDDFDNVANATFDVSEIAQEGDKVVVLHFDEITQQWEYITEATVDENGKITADFTSFSPVAFVVVKEDGSLGDIEYVNGIAISGTTSCEVGDTSTLTATVDPETATNTEVIWSSSNESIAKVDAATGVVTGIAAGTATITATAADGNGASNSVEFTVTEPGVSGVLAIYSETDNSLRFYNTEDKVVEGGTYNNLVVTEIYTGFDTDSYTNATKTPWYNQRYNIKTVIVEDEGISPVSTAYWFKEMQNSTSINLAKLDTSNVTDMSSMFAYCYNLETLDINGIDVSNVEDFNSMFYYCQALGVLDLSGFSTPKAKDMAGMFSQCYNLRELLLYNFETQNVYNMSGMFQDCYSLTTLDLSSFDTIGYPFVNAMFYNCSELTTIYVSNRWRMNQLFEEIYDETTPTMFSGCTNLVGAVAYDESNANDKTYANGETGYLTLKASSGGSGNTSAMYVIYSSNDNSLRFYNNGDYGTIHETQAAGGNYNNLSITELYDETNFATGEIPWADIVSSIHSVIVEDEISPGTLNYWFEGLSSCESMDLSKLNTSYVQSMVSTFSGCTSLTTIYVSDLWSTESVADSANMFQNCSSLVGAVAYDASNANDYTYANYETGYLTYKAAE